MPRHHRHPFKAHVYAGEGEWIVFHQCHDGKDGEYRATYPHHAQALADAEAHMFSAHAWHRAMVRRTSDGIWLAYHGSIDAHCFLSCHTHYAQAMDSAHQHMMSHL